MQTFTATSFAVCAAGFPRLTWCGFRMLCLKASWIRKFLAWAAVENRVLITNDRNTMVGFAYQRVTAGEPVPGLIATTNEQSIGSAINDILLIGECMSEQEISDKVVVYLPLPG